MQQIKQKVGNHTFDFTYCPDDKYIWGAKEILDMSDLHPIKKAEYLEFIHQFKGYETAAGWNITVQAMIPSVEHGYSWATTKRYFRKQRFPNAKTVKEVILECIKLPYMIKPLETQYEGYKIVKAFRDPECPMSKSEIRKLDYEFKDKYGIDWSDNNAEAQSQMGTEMYLRGYDYVEDKWDAVDYEAYCNHFQGKWGDDDYCEQLKRERANNGIKL